MATKRTNRRRKTPSSQVISTRFLLIVGFFAIWFLGVTVRLVHLQVNQAEWLRDKAVDQRQDTKKSKMLRGTIYDRDGRPLAMSIKVKTLYADPTEIADVAVAARSIAKITKIDANQLTKQLTEAKAKNKRFVPIVKKIDEETVARLNKSLAVDGVKKADSPQFTGLHWSEDQARSYPYGPMAAQVIGVSNLDDTGIVGIEQSQDDILHGAVTSRRVERDRLGRIYEEVTEDREKPGDVTLTIGASYQHKVEQALENGVKASNAKSGMAIAMNPKTGEILAMANYPSFDPNAMKDAVPANITNHAIQSVYSPGSVMKLITYGAAREKHLFSLADTIDAGNGTITVADHPFKDSHHVGNVSYPEAFAHSSNVCAIKTALRVGKDDFYSTLTQMGFGSKTGVELPAETVGIVRAPEKWYGDSLASMSIGYEIGVTALQMVTAYATIANDGVKVSPRIIKEIKKADEPPVRPEVGEAKRVFSVEAARDLRTMLKQVVLTGTGKRAQLNGYTSGGKTGTAWKFNSATKSVDSSKYISSFIGMAPAENPEVVIAVVIDEPKAGGRDGGGSAAPVFRAIAEQLLPELGVAQNGPAVKELPVENDIPEIVEPTKSDKKVAANSGDTKPSSDVDTKKKDAKPTNVKPAAVEPKKTTKPQPRLKPAGNTSAGLWQFVERIEYTRRT